MEKIVNDIYNATIDNLLIDVPNEYVEELKNAYKDYLISRFGKFEIESNKKEIFIQRRIKELNEKNSNKHYLRKLQMYEIDDYLSKLSVLSNYIFAQAIKKGNNQAIDNIDYDLTIQQLNLFLSKVKEYNKAIAQNLYGDALLDLSYIYEKSDNLSLRLVHYIPKTKTSRK